jgi:methylase of polypeptide subunit release factors
MVDTIPEVGEGRRAVFGSLTISYDSTVLEPRSWTTAQSHWAADLLRTSPEGPVLELCSGAGHIGLLAVALTPRRLVQVDVSPRACAFARANAAAAGLAVDVEVLEGPVDGALGPARRFAGVIADPPWVRSGEVGRFPEDPLLAIDGGQDGLDLARSCVEVAARHLEPGGWVLLQMGTPEQVDGLQAWLAGPSAPALVVREVRGYGDRGVLVHLGPA